MLKLAVSDLSNEKGPQSSASAGHRPIVAFWLALVGGVLMLLLPLIPVEYNGPACFTSSPCSTISPWALTWLPAVIIVLLIFSGAATIIVVLILRISASRLYPFLGGLLIALSVVYLSGLATALVVTVFSGMGLGLLGSAIAASFGPLLVFLSGLLLVKDAGRMS